LTKDLRQNIALSTVGKVSQDELDFQIQNADATKKPTDIPLEHLTDLSLKSLEVWYHKNRNGLFVQEWLKVIFRCLRARVEDQCYLWHDITPPGGGKFSLETLASILQSSAAALNEDPLGAKAIASDINYMHMRINTKAVCEALTDPKCRYEILFEENSNFNLFLLDDLALCQRFASLGFDGKKAVSDEQVLAVLKGLFRSWRPSRRWEFVSRCENYLSVRYPKNCLLAGATLPSTQEADQWDKWRLERAENRAAKELVRHAERYQKRRMDVRAPLHT